MTEKDREIRLNLEGGTNLSTRALLKLGATQEQIDRILPVCRDEQLEMRIESVLDIYEALKIMFDNQQTRIDFMQAHNQDDFFAGRTPLDVISSGDTKDLILATRRLEQICLC